VLVLRAVAGGDRDQASAPARQGRPVNARPAPGADQRHTKGSQPVGSLAHGVSTAARGRPSIVTLGQRSSQVTFSSPVSARTKVSSLLAHGSDGFQA